MVEGATGRRRIRIYIPKNIIATHLYIGEDGNGNLIISRIRIPGMQMKRVKVVKVRGRGVGYRIEIPSFVNLPPGRYKLVISGKEGYLYDANTKKPVKRVLYFGL